MFLDVLVNEAIDDINAGFLACARDCVEFPVPADVLKASRASARERRRLESERVALEEKRRDDEIKERRFLTDGNGESYDAVKLHEEFQELLKASKLKSI